MKTPQTKEYFRNYHATKSERHNIKCVAPECTDRAWAVKAKLCLKHYHRLKDTGSLELKIDSKPCIACGVSMTLTGADLKTRRYCSQKCRGLTHRKRDTKTPDERKAYQYEWRLKQYGLSVPQYEQMLTQQNNCCGICGSHESEAKGGLAVDHCHKTGKVRGILCRKCNASIGALGDSIESLRKALAYLESRP